jgi:Tol biopolymer transport system component
MSKLVSFALVLALVAIAFAAGMRFGSRELRFAASPDNRRVAFALERRCLAGGRCQTLWLGPSRGDATKLVTLGDDDGSCDEIAWTRDGKRVAFLIDGYQLRFYDAETSMPAGQVRLLEPQGRPSTRIVRGVTFSENGRAVTFDDCPRAQSGCRAGFAAVPR